MKRLLLSLLSLVLGGSMAFGYDLSFNTSAGAQNITNLINYPVKVTRITVVNNSAGTNMVWAIIDAPQTNHANYRWPGGSSNQAYMTVSSYLTNLTTMYTNFSGYTNVYTVSNLIWSYTNTVAAGLTPWRVLFTGVLNTNSSTTLVLPDAGVDFTWGLSFTNNPVSGGGSVQVTFSPTL